MNRDGIRRMTQKAAPAAARMTLAGVLLAAAVPKLIRPAAFLEALDAWRMLPWFAVAPVAILLPWVEAVTGLALLTLPRLRRGALLLGGALPAIFAVALTVNRLRGVEVPCGCFSLNPAAAPAGWAHLALNLALIALAIAAARAEARG